ncbi:MAG TPA: FGGY-family carbohydrate kinase, partial [Trueperaceae bacterium]|nr:FGGY-family carbohydrate kinase [Trueperaceae bacterium]
VDGWGVDYGLLDDDDRLVDLPYSYRDSRTAGWQGWASEIGVERLYQTTGVQLMGINTIFQLAADAPARLARTARLLLLPDLLVHQLCGWTGAERSNMSTTGLMDARTGAWSGELIDAVGAPRRLFPEPTTAGAMVGSWRGVPVALVGSHDTASAFLGVPSAAGATQVFVSAGSWVIVGVEREQPDTTQRARELNFSNEAGGLGGVRFLKNVVGLWMLEQCLVAWGDPAMATLMGEAAAVDVAVPVFDAADHRFVSTTDMVAEVCAATGLPADAPRAVMARSIIESIVAGVVRVIRQLELVTGERAERVVLVGGGSRIPLVADLLAELSGHPVVVGSSEATALGNAVVQGLALGVFDRSQSQAWLADSVVTA